jgi:hypothetical protein
MAKRPDTRIQWTLKGPFDSEFMALVKKAAERQGQTIVAFVADTLRDRSQAILKGDDGDTPRNTPPARLEDVSGTLAELLTMAKEEREARQAQAERITRLEQAQQPVETTPHGGVPETADHEARRLRIALRRKGRRR